MSQTARDRLRHRAAARDGGWWCAYCRRPLACSPTCPAGARTGAYATLDHRVPRVRGGTYALHNVVLACSPCNGARGARDWPLGVPVRQHLVRAYDVGRHGALTDPARLPALDLLERTLPGWPASWPETKTRTPEARAQALLREAAARPFVDPRPPVDTPSDLS